MENILLLLSSVAVIVQDSIKLLPKNDEFVALISILLLSASFLTFYFVCLLVKKSSLNSSDYTDIFASITGDFRLINGVYVSYICAAFIISLILQTSIIILSSVSYSDETLTSKELLIKVVKSSIRAFCTQFFTTLCELGYFFFVATLASPLLMSFDTYGLLAIVLGVAAYVFSLYLSVVWVLSIVISVVEESSYGIKALSKAEGLIKGKRLQGFILNIGFGLLSLLLFQGLKAIAGGKYLANRMTIFWLFLVNWSCLLMMFQLVTYTVLYFNCKKYHDEEVELQESIS